MSDKNNSLPKVPEAKIIVKKHTRISMVWVIPLVAAIAGVWIAVTNVLNRGPEITIVFQSADGIEASKTKVNYNGLDIGVINSIKFSKDRKSIIATAQMDSGVKDLLVKDSKFWVVRPRISGMTVTGLDTLLAGDYIGMQLGKSKQRASHFTALQTPPLTGDVPGRIYTLKTSSLGSLGIGTPVFFRQLQAGQVVSFKLDPSGEFISVKIFIEAPYDKYINTETKFWKASGIDISMTSGGIQIKSQSLMSILEGGVAFGTPKTSKSPPLAKAQSTFSLFGNQADAFKPPANEPYNYLLVFKHSVRGLALGAPVQFHGITIGEVTAISPELDVNKNKSYVEVTISVDPKRYGVNVMDFGHDKDKLAVRKKIINLMVARGFRGRLNTGNLLTGALYVALVFIHDAPAVAVDWSQSPVQLPTVPNALNSIENRVATLLKDIDKTVKGIDQAVNGKHGTITKVDKLFVNADKTLGKADKMIIDADKLLNNANLMIEPNSVMNSELNKLLQQSNGAARALRILADYLERHPEALIYGKKEK